MLFNSYAFLFLFLPVTLLVFLRLELKTREAALSWLVIASLFFYAWWKPVYLLLLLASMAFNFGIGLRLQRNRSRGLLTLGIVFNLGLLAWFKYAHFIAGSLSSLSGVELALDAIVLPLAI